MALTNFRGGRWWSFKDGVNGATYRYSSNYTAANTKWSHYVYTGSIWRISIDNAYTSAIYYITYK